MATTKFNRQAYAWQNRDIMINGVYFYFCEQGKDYPMHYQLIKRSYKRAHELFMKIADRNESKLIQMYFDEDDRMWKNVTPNDDKWLKYNANNFMYIVGYND